MSNGDTLLMGDIDGFELSLGLSLGLLGPGEEAGKCTGVMLSGERRCERRMTVGLPNVVESFVDTILVKTAGVDLLRFTAATELLCSSRVSDFRS